MCLNGFALHYDGHCVACPQNCLDCYFGGPDSDYNIINYSSNP